MASKNPTPQLDLELSAMQTIATALARLDPAARARTLMWLRLRFDLDTVSAQPTAAPASAHTTVPALEVVSTPTRAAYDDALSVDGLADLFDSVDAMPRAALFDYDAAKPPAEAAPPAVAGLLSQLATGFQELARDWSSACSTPAEEMPPPSPLSASS
jgi:hypothetical protein